MKLEKKYIIIIAIAIVVLSLFGGTYAFWLWRGNITKISYTTELPFSCAADGGVHASTVALAPAACTHDRFAIQREIKITPEIFSTTTSVFVDLILKIEQIGTGLSNSSNFKYAITSDPNSCTNGVYTSGNFKNKTAGTTITILNDDVFNYSPSSLTRSYYLYIWIDPIEENPDVLVQDFSFSLSAECTQGAKTATGGAAMLINKANGADITNYEDGDTGEMYTFSQPATDQVAATTDYRYIGDSPNNYITFNGETWRIIGVFDGKIKIIKDERIMSTGISWDYKKTGIGSSTSNNGSNDWVDAQLMYMLNDNDIATHVAKKTDYTFDGTNVKDSSGNIIYQKGCRPAVVDGTVTYSCTANTWSLNSTALSQIEDTIYYLGGTGIISEKSAADYYTFERGETKFSDTHSTNWTGKVGLMYPSDYAYTFAYGVDDTCYSNAYTCNNSTPASSWLYNSSYSQWTIASYSRDAYHVFDVISSGVVSRNSVNGTYGVRPVVYLKSDITLTGSGTVDDKYQIVSQSSGGNGGSDIPSASDGALMLINKANGSNVTTYSSGNTGEMYTFSQPATAQTAATTDYRYIGDSPNNYITFNDETWRIIGVFDGKIKIIRDTVLTSTRWDYKKTGIGSSTSDYGSNDWVDSQLMYMLNDNDIATHVAKKTGYTFDGTNVKDASGNIIYQKGCKPAAVDGTVTYSCTSNTWSLNSTALSQIEDTIYYLGGTSTTSGQSAADYYTFERGEAKFNDTRSTNWTGKVGLMYPSDYAYTFAYGVDDTCYSNTYTCNNSTPASSWLYNSSNQWTLAPDSSVAYTVFGVSSTGYVNNYYAYGTNRVRPVVYLKSDITLTGSGTVDDKYVIS